MNAQQRTLVDAVLSNDGVSSDEELVEYFTKECGIPKKEAVQVVKDDRTAYLCTMPRTVEEAIDLRHDRKNPHAKMIRQAFALRGYDLVDTGGGCTAYRLEYAHGVEILVTTTNDPSAPVHDCQRIYVGLYNCTTGNLMAQAQMKNASAWLKFIDENGHLAHDDLVKVAAFAGIISKGGRV